MQPTNPLKQNTVPGNGAENTADEAKILADQDETLDINADPTETENDPQVGSVEFARGEIDVKEAMDRTMRKMNHH